MGAAEVHSEVLAATLADRQDLDNDGFGNAAVVMQACLPPSGFITNSGDCDDTNAAINPLAVDIPGDGIDQNCDGIDGGGGGDADGDGWTVALGDCDDANAAIHPGAAEVCDGLDNDCDGLVDDADPDVVGATWYMDADGDGFGDPLQSLQSCMAPPGYVSNGTDCDDNDPQIYPGAFDIPGDGIDQDCDGFDGGGDLDGDGYTVAQGDCDDNDANINPGEVENCDFIDNNCNGTIDEGFENDWWFDVDADGYGDASHVLPDLVTCVPQTNMVDNNLDCDDDDPAINPDAFDAPGDGVDQDCDGVDAALLDADGDGFDAVDDCDDTDGLVFPGASEICEDGIDQDCDGADAPCLTDTGIADTGDHANKGGGCRSNGAGGAWAALFLPVFFFRRKENR